MDSARLNACTLLTCDQAADLLSVSPATIRAWTCRRKIPCVRLNGTRTVRYRVVDLERIIKAGSSPALRAYPSNSDGENGGGE